MVAARTEVDTSAGTTFERFASGTIHNDTDDTAAAAAIGIRCDVTQVEDIRRLIEHTIRPFRTPRCGGEQRWG